MKTVGRSTLNDLIAALQSDIDECNELSAAAGLHRELRLDEGEPTPRFTRLTLLYQNLPLPKFFLELDPSGNGAKINCPYGKREITVLPRWNGQSGTTVYEMDGRECSSLSEVSRAILLPVLQYPNYDWSDALERVEESQK